MEAPTARAAWKLIDSYGWPRDEIRKHEEGGKLYLDAGGWDELVEQAIAEMKRTPASIRDAMETTLRAAFAGNAKAWKRVLEGVK